MKGFIWGVVLTLVVGAGVALFVAETGRLEMRADVPPSRIESLIASHATETSIERNAPKRTDPLMPKPATILSGAILYHDHCAACHGDPLHPQSPLAKTLDPPPPQFMSNPANMPDDENFFIVKHGIRWTGMPGWEKGMSDQEIWQVVTFLDNMNNSNLPDSVKQVFANAQPGEMAAGDTAPEEGAAAAATKAPASGRKSSEAPARAHPHK